jgi:hypothetical protein
MVNWLCPHCQRRMYSACEFHQVREIVCIYCNETFTNPFYRAPVAVHNETRV